MRSLLYDLALATWANSQTLGSTIGLVLIWYMWMWLKARLTMCSQEVGLKFSCLVKLVL